MNFYYESGQPMPKNVKELILYLAKVGTITTKNWKKNFATGGPRRQREQLRNLVIKGVIEPHSCRVMNDAWVLGSWSKVFLKGLSRSYVTPIPPQLIEHDEVVGIGLVELMRSGQCDLWFSEKELKMLRPKEWKLDLGRIGVKYPDATLAFNKNGHVWLVAIEYERTGKDRRRYEAILRAYSLLPGVHQIIFIVEEQGARERIVKVCRDLRETRIGFIAANDWKKNAYEAQIQKEDRKTSFKDVLKALP